MWLGIMIPFIGTTLGAACVFFMQKAMNITLQKILSGFAAGVMVAASVWSLLIPSMDMAENLGKLAFLPAAAGMMFGIAFLLFLDRLIPHLHVNEEKPEGPKTSLKKSSMLILAVTLHNIPEGMAVGAVFAGMLADSELITVMGAFALSIGIAIQNLPEGAIISMPVCAAGLSKKKAFVYGMLSGVVEPVGAVLTIWLSGFLIPLLPYLLSFAAGAMIYVVVEELIPEAVEGEHTNIGTISFAVGFVLMMALDVALG
ncbi:MAG: ZIP family metal transporter [Lachnospiraceae bacterium]|nr:ZIP family metal transporter [Lachnospiraceae bacterium]